MSWRQIRITTDYPEFAEEVFLAHGAHSVTMVDAADTPILEPGPGDTPLWGQTMVVGLFGPDVDEQIIGRALADMLPDGSDRAASTEALDDTDWVRACLKDAKPLLFGRRLWVCPSGHQVEDPEAVIVDLDPGLAFGTGTHPTTSLCLRWLDANPPVNRRVLDYGCGSGILAVAALKLGASDALCVDIDPQALTATADNAETNDVADAIRLAQTDDEPDESADLILANILAGPLVELAPRLGPRLAPGGDIVLAGLLREQAPALVDAYAPYVSLHEAGEDGDWLCLAGRRTT